MSSTIQAELPPDLILQAERFVAEGGAADFNGLLTEALRRYLDSHQRALAEKFVRDDVAWGLDGND